MINNLTEGKPLKLLFFFAVPMVVGNLFQQLYNMVDSMVVGRFVGEDALCHRALQPNTSFSLSVLH